MVEEVSLNNLNISQATKQTEYAAGGEHYKFSESFWDEKLSGFDILSSNLRNSQTNVRELEIFVREVANCEDQYVKQLNKVTAQFSKFSTDTILSPVWQNVIKDFNEHTAWSHLQFMNQLYDLLKDIQTYYNYLRKKKRKIRENEIKTVNCIDSFRFAKQQLAKARDQYHQLSAEKSAAAIDAAANANPSIFSMLRQNSERRLHTAMDEYKQAIERYNQARVEFEQRYVDSCNSFQLNEAAHLRQMKAFLNTYVQLVGHLNTSRQKTFGDYSSKLNGVYTVDLLIQQFIINKGEKVIFMTKSL